MLEDDFTYVLRKALKGMDLAPSEAARRAGLPETQVLAFSRGHFSAEVARRLAPVLELSPHAFAAHADYEPAPPLLPCISRLMLPFGEDTVNAWLIREGDTTLLFDAGDSPGDCTGMLDKKNIPVPNAVFITHDHHDHIADIPRLTIRGSVPMGWGIAGTRPIQPGDQLKVGHLTLHTLDLSGHALRSLGYLIQGLSLPILITGDSLFAGSVGGTPNPERYQMSLHTLRTALSTLPDETLVLPGHGPSTCLRDERERNPFLAAA